MKESAEGHVAVDRRKRATRRSTTTEMRASALARVRSKEVGQNRRRERNIQIQRQINKSQLGTQEWNLAQQPHAADYRHRWYSSIANQCGECAFRFSVSFLSAFRSAFFPPDAFVLHSRSQIISQFDMDILSVGQAVAVLASLFSVMWLGAYLALRRVAALGSA